MNKVQLLTVRIKELFQRECKECLTVLESNQKDSHLLHLLIYLPWANFTRCKISILPIPHRLVVKIKYGINEMMDGGSN